jgi:uracil-DNA glycosylase
MTEETRSTELQTFDDVFRAIKSDPQNAEYTAAGIDPLYSVAADARVMVIGQAPGRIAQDTRIPWNDKSGDRLRDWMGVDRATFYDPHQVAIVPMDFYFPGKGKGGDLPPRKGFAEKWHPVLLGMMPQVRLTVLVGTYAVHRYLGLKQSVPLTGVVRDWQRWQPEYFPLVHPSPRNQLWMKKNPWFEEETLPALRTAVAEALA